MATSPRADPALEFGLLGPVTATRLGEPLAVPGSRPLTVLALLAATANRVVPVASLADALWDGQPGDNADATVQVYVFRLRKALAHGGDGRAGPVERLGGGYRLLVAPGGTDVERHEDLRRRAAAALAQGDAGAADRWCGEALSLWRGPALADLPGSRYVDDLAATWEEQRLAITELHVDAALVLGRAEQLVPELQDLVRRHPLREGLAGRLMLALYRSGRQADALGAYTALRTRLDEELGLAPGPGLQALERAVLQQDPRLDAPGPWLGEAEPDERTEQVVEAAAPVAWVTVDDADPVPVPRTPWTVGRHRDCDLVLTDSRVSRRHAQLVVVAGELTVVDLGSTNGTRVDGQPITCTAIPDGAAIGIGSHTLAVRLSDPAG